MEELFYSQFWPKVKEDQIASDGAQFLPQGFDRFQKDLETMIRERLLSSEFISQATKSDDFALSQLKLMFEYRVRGYPQVPSKPVNTVIQKNSFFVCALNITVQRNERISSQKTTIRRTFFRSQL